MNTLIRLIMMAGMFNIAQPLAAHADNTQPAQEDHISQRADKMEKRVDQKVKRHKMTQAQGDQVKKELEGVKAEDQQDRAANGGKLNKDQKKKLRGELKNAHQEIKNNSAPAASPSK